MTEDQHLTAGLSILIGLLCISSGIACLTELAYGLLTFGGVTMAFGIAYAVAVSREDR